MIKVSVDEAVAYDMLAILFLKQKAYPTEDGSIECEHLWLDLLFELGGDLHSAILKSDEYAALLAVNQSIFATLDFIKQREPHAADARLIDDLNYRRWKAKQALQARFFPESPLTERKVGYREDDKS